MLFGYTLYSYTAGAMYYAVAIICGAGLAQQTITYWRVRNRSLPFHMVLNFSLAVSFLLAAEAERTASISKAVILEFASVFALLPVVVSGALLLIVRFVETLEATKQRSNK